MSPTKLTLVIGATGAQGQAVIAALLAPNSDGTASPYNVRALTRNLESPQAQGLAARGVQLVQGTFHDFNAVAKALDGAYGAWVNTDGSTGGEVAEIYAGMRIFEVAKRVPSLRHYVWSNLRFVFKVSGFNPEYRAEHMDAKGRVGEWLSVQPSVLTHDGLVWSQATFAPMNVRKDGTVVFAAPVGDSRVPLIALKDVGWWARWTFDHRAEASARELNVASDLVGWDDIVKTLTKVTGKPAVYLRLTLDEWWTNFDERADNPLSSDKKRGDGSTTIKQNYSAFWRVLRDGIIDKDMEWIRSVHPGTFTLERWMRENNYDGRGKTVLKKALESNNAWGFRPDIAKDL
ncbi:NAD(P)-binding protein [Mycena maculata]|uniref:NAD(P)-binding protein n=1 Tax=Mycena maculata TaxID=230809 RepID=A0AAD7IXJ4_9AGAR|nr:NAD(P)-binding protein [Mycena maculata]